jgi:transcriptional regulator GlxA family with amidase domain
MAEAQRARTVGIMIFPDVELLDFAGPYEAFTAVNYSDDTKLFDVFTVAERPEPLNTRAGVRIVPDYTFETAPKIDILVVPGGQGTRREIDNPVAIDWIRSVASEAELTTSVCTGSFLIGRAGSLRAGSRATSHWGSIQRMRETFPGVEVLEGVRFVDDGAVISSAGVSAGIDMSLHVIERLCGREAAAGSARLMEYDYWTPGEATAPETLAASSND